jgi:putative membrane protein
MRHAIRQCRQAAVALALGLPAPAALAHGGEIGWRGWSLSPEVLLPLLIVAAVYWRGVRKRRPRVRKIASGFEPAFFMLGLLVLFLALQSPIDPLGERSFTMHQVQHLLLRSVAPLLLFLPSPQRTLVAGWPSPVRRAVGRLGRIALWRGLFAALVHPATVTMLFILSLYVWQYPPYFETALRNDAVHYLMHVTMLAAGILFWWRIFDDRPSAPRFGARIIMLWVATVANIAIGAYITLKSTVLYPVYDTLGRLWYTASEDETLGGIVMWIPGSNMALIALLVVLYRWGLRDRRQRVDAVGLPAPGAASVPVADVRARQQASARLAATLGVLSASIFLVFLGVIALNRSGFW